MDPSRLVPLSWYVRLADTRAYLRSRARPIPEHIAQNLRACDIGATLGPVDTRRIVQEHIRTRIFAGANKKFPHLRGFERPERWPVSGFEHLDLALGGGRGAILATAHFASSNLIPAILRTHGRTVLQVSTPSQAKRSVTTERTPAGLNVRPIFEALARNGTVAVAGDGIRAAAFESVTFLGTTFPLATGWMKIAMRTGAPVLPTYAFPGTRRHPIKIEIGAPLPVDPASSVAQNLQHYADSLDAQIRARPELWIRWRQTDLFAWARSWTEQDLAIRYEPVIHRRGAGRVSSPGR